ncbi:MAG: 50S ribosomal protein L24 [Victivallaceae bacterium]|jgi:large subunit ribosomal protein L24
MKKFHVKKGDKVVVNAGSWKNEEAKIIAVLTKKDRVVLEFSNLSPQKRELIGKRSVKKSKLNPNGGLVDRSVSVHVSNVTPVEGQKSE